MQRKELIKKIKYKIGKHATKDEIEEVTNILIEKGCSKENFNMYWNDDLLKNVQKLKKIEIVRDFLANLTRNPLDSSIG